MSEPMLRRISLLMSSGRVRVTTEKKQIQTHQVQLNDRETIDNVPSIGNYGFASRPQADADAMVLFLGGDRSKGVIIGTSDQRFHFQVEGGEVALHDDQGQSIHLTRKGIVIKGGGLPMTITGTPKVTIEADVHITKTLTADTDVVAGGNAVSLVHHVNTGVKAGGDLTGPPK